MTSFADDALGPALADLGAHLHAPDHSLWTRVRAEIEDRGAEPAQTWSGRRARVLVAVAAVVAVLVALTVSIAPAREAVADFLGIGSTGVVRVERLPAGDGPSAADDLPSRGDVEALRGELADAGFGLPNADLVGPPRAWRVDPDGETVVAFADVVFGQQRAGDVPALKRVPPSGRIESTTVDGEPALWVEGPHVRRVGGREYRSESALLWTAGDRELRLEGNLTLAAMRRVAESVAPVR